jgi:hypothetical protein
MVILAAPLRALKCDAEKLIEPEPHGCAKNRPYTCATQQPTPIGVGPVTKISDKRLLIAFPN